jgi:hypothetical protein
LGVEAHHQKRGVWEWSEGACALKDRRVEWGGWGGDINLIIDVYVEGVLFGII